MIILKSGIPDKKSSQSRSNRKINAQRGNVVLMLFAGIAMVGVLGVATTNFMQGPLRSAIKVTRQNTAETQMTVGAQVSVMAAATAANNGDCDADGMIEPFEWLDAGTSPAPVGGGLVPMNIGISKKDPWGTDYGYCVWDYGTQSLQAACQVTAGTNRRLQGTTNPAYPVVALISAGPDKTFSTTCRNFSIGATRADQNNNGVLTDAGDFPLVGKANPNDDDIIFAYTYQEAMAASGGLWTLKPNDPAKAVINKDLEVSGGATFSGTGMFARLAAAGSNFLEIISPLKLASPTNAPTCNLANSGVLRLAADSKSIEICDGAAAPPAWAALGAGGAGQTTTMMTVTATGSFTKTAVGDFDIFEFTGDGGLQVTALGNDGDFGSRIEYLIVGGGGSTGDQSAGGAGGVLGGTMTATVQSYSVVVGAAGDAGTGGAAGDGKKSKFAGLEALGGGAGAQTNNAGGRNGGSGGGGSGGGIASTPAGSGTAGQGFNGCPGFQAAYGYSGGGGGGAGGPCPGTYQPGPGISSSITGNSTMYACGGQGFQLADPFDTGRAGCQTTGAVNTAPVQNRGHGAGGQARTASSGVVILKIKQRGGTAISNVVYPLRAPDGSAASPTYSFMNQPTKGIYLDSGSIKISGLAVPTANDQAANKAYVDTAVAAAGGGGVTYLGATTTTYTGNLGGVVGANNKCVSQFGTGARMMRLHEVELINPTLTLAAGWANSHCTSQFTISGDIGVFCDGRFYFIGSTNPAFAISLTTCQLWASASSAAKGTVLQLSGGESRYLDTCNVAKPIHCVK